MDGAANAELIHRLAKLFDMLRAEVEILSSATLKQKLVRIHHPNPTAAEQMLLAALGA